jgi:NAD(P)-dependent dehydrogenase (short-subunit alcohol dehydrogenase family)
MLPLLLQELSALPPLPGCAPGQVEFAQLDLCSLKNVRQFAKSFNAQRRRLDVLVCNAGIMSPANKLVTQDGLEMQFQVRDGLDELSALCSHFNTRGRE